MRLRCRKWAEGSSVAYTLPVHEDIDSLRSFIKEKVKPVMNAFKPTTKWEAYELLQRLLLARGYGEARIVAVITECEQKAATGANPETPTDLMHMVNDAVTPYGGPIHKDHEPANAPSSEMAPLVAKTSTGMTIGECFDRFLKLRLKDWKQSTARAYLNTQGRLGELGLESIPVADLKRSQLDSVRQSMMDAGQKAGTINLLFRQIRQAITEVEQAYGEDEGLDWSRTLKNLSGMKALKDEAAKVDRAWPPEAIREVSDSLSLKITKGYRMGDITKLRRLGAYWQLWLALATAGRKSELEASRLSDVVYDEHHDRIGLHIRGTKTKSSDRLVPLVDGLNGFPLAYFKAYISTLREVSGEEDPLLCFGASLENLTKRERARYTMDNGDGLTIHGLRHTAATTLAKLGLEPALLSQFMGHSGSSLGGADVTLRYITGALDARRHEWLKLYDAIEPLVRLNQKLPENCE